MAADNAYLRGGRQPAGDRLGRRSRPDGPGGQSLHILAASALDMGDRARLCGEHPRPSVAEFASVLISAGQGFESLSRHHISPIYQNHTPKDERDENPVQCYLSTVSADRKAAVKASREAAPPRPAATRRRGISHLLGLHAW